MFKCFKNKEFLRKFFQISLPIMVSTAISFFVSFIDNIMVGTVSNETVSGVYAANQVTYLFSMGIFGILEGSGIFIQQYNGSKDFAHIKQCFRYKWFIIILFLLISTPLVYLFGIELVKIYSRSDSNFSLIVSEGMSYLNIATLSYIPWAITMIYSTSFREIGETKYPMYSSIIAIILNCLLNALFIIGLNMGGVGAAIATLISRIIEMMYIISVSYFKKAGFAFQAFKELRIDKELLKSISKKTIFLFINEIGFAIGMMLQSLAFSQRDGVLSSISITYTVSEVFSIFASGFSVAIGVLVGSDLGRDDFEGAKENTNMISFLGFYLAVLSGVILIIFNRFIPLLFKEVVISQKLLASKLIIIFGAIFPFQMIALTSYFVLRAGGKTFLTFVFDSGTMLVLYIPVAWYLALKTNLDIVYIFLIVRLIDIIKAIVGIYFLKKGTWLVNITIDKKDATT